MKLNLIIKTQLDKEAIERFRTKQREPLAIPDSIQEEYRLNEERTTPSGGDRRQKRRQKIKVVVDQGPPLEQYRDATGYRFSWGHILERRVAQFVVWDFCLTHLLARYHRAELRLRDLQERLFEFLEEEVEYTAREPALAAGLIEGWAIYPGAAVGAFTEVIHFASEEAAREWTADILIEKVLPKAIAKAREYADRKADGGGG
jgi:hypothetical protein